MCIFNIQIIKIKNKNENTFNEKLNIYNNIIEKIIAIYKGDIIYNNLANIGFEFDYDINKDFKRRINIRIYSLYVDGDFL